MFRGEALGALGETSGEVIFNTAMTGYQEILTDPSYRGQIVTMTYPLIGNYGVNEEDIESNRPWVNGFIVREASAVASNFRSSLPLGTYLERHGIVGLETAVALLLDRLVRPGVLPLATLVSRLSRDPARLLDLPGGTLSPGTPGDITILDVEAEAVVDPARFKSRSRNTPFGGWRLRGGPWKTIVGGTVVSG